MCTGWIFHTPFFIKLNALYLNYLLASFLAIYRLDGSAMSPGTTSVCSLPWPQLQGWSLAYSESKINVCGWVQMENLQLFLLLSICWVQVSRCINRTQEWARNSPRDGQAVVLYRSNDVFCSACESRDRLRRTGSGDPPALTAPALETFQDALAAEAATSPLSTGKLKAEGGQD